MKMVLFESFKTQTAQADWSKNLELGLLDCILESHPELLEYVRADITRGLKESNFGRKDTPSVEQILRAALFKEIRGLDYRGLEYAQSDSRICGRFIKLDATRPYSFQMYQSYISKGLIYRSVIGKDGNILKVKSSLVSLLITSES